MHYIVGQEVLGGGYSIHLIQHNKEYESYMIWIQKENEVLLWKEFKTTMPISLEYNINCIASTALVVFPYPAKT